MLVAAFAVWNQRCRHIGMRCRKVTALFSYGDAMLII
jgi:S-adenosylmethionine:tRNA-ribosyltransferase-isomerase (queuine synthetase)